MPTRPAIKILSVLTLICAAACGGQERTKVPNAQITVPPGVQISDKDAILLAEAEVRRRDGWKSMESRIYRKNEKGFQILVWGLPKYPGNARHVHVSTDGVIISYTRGK